MAAPIALTRHHLTMESAAIPAAPQGARDAARGSAGTPDCPDFSVVPLGPGLALRTGDPGAFPTMSALVSLPLLWSQVTLPGVPEGLKAIVLWLLLFGE